MAVGSFSAGLSGLNANATYLSVIGNNLANINTIGYKTSAVSFADLVSQTVGGTSVNPMQVGLGVVTGSISPVFSQGAHREHPRGDQRRHPGQRLLRRPRRATATPTPAPATSPSTPTATLVTPDGWRVQGYTQIDPVDRRRSSRPAAPTDIVVPPGVLRAPVATTNVRAQINLDATPRPIRRRPTSRTLDPDLRRARQLARRHHRPPRRPAPARGPTRRRCRRPTSTAAPARSSSRPAR